jgi:murein DD-endopeptidase MepM/ murein hydrolase activator NlpD
MAALLVVALVVSGGADGGAAGRSAAVAPVGGPVVRHFDAPAHPYGPGHRGVDLAAEEGEVVRSALAGTVAFSGTVAGTGWVTVDHGGGLATTYGPLSGRVDAGSAVRAGDVLGVIAQGEHLDWGARLDGDYVDPLKLLVRWQARLTSGDRLPR